MPDLQPLTALAGAEPRVANFGALTIAENSGLALVSLALRRGMTPPSPFVLALPDPGSCSGGGGLSAFWTGPGQWMIEGEGRAGEDFASAVKEAAPGCSVTEQTDGWVAFEISSQGGGEPIRRLMRKLVNLNALEFGAGRATRTGLEHMSVFVIRRADDRLAVLGMRSAAESLWHALAAAASRLQAEPA